MRKTLFMGDVRDVNIVVNKHDSRDIKLINWDWAGLIGEATYPHNINNQSVARPDGVESCRQVEHDLGIVELLSPYSYPFLSIVRCPMFCVVVLEFIRSYVQQYELRA